MSFVSAEFLIFFAVVFAAYHLLSSTRTQNALIVIASYFFYAWWDWRFVFLLFGISLANFGAAIVVEDVRTRFHRVAALVIALSASILTLVAFKYLDMVIDVLAAALELFKINLGFRAINLILPLGISFITFQGIAYVVDVWRGQHKAERDFIKFLAFKSFFPQLVAGPIERAGNLLDQFSRPRSLSADKANRAVWLLVYGYALKLVVADSMAPLVDSLFVAEQPFGWSVVLGTFAFGIQIYADFCGYSLIAKGAALLLGFELVWNFRFPYWATSPGEFWGRWHISLSSWLRDYLYIPLGGNRHGELATLRNLLITMGLGGLWHGASWNFVLWGLLHGSALAGWRLIPGGAFRNGAGQAIGWCITMTVVFCGWFLFRSTSVQMTGSMLAALGNWEWVPVHTALLKAVLAVTVPVAAVEWIQQRRQDDFFLMSLPRWCSHPATALLVFLYLAMSRDDKAGFIYFQF